MTKRALGPGAKCCGDPVNCELCVDDQPVPAPVDVEMFTLDEVAEELGLDLDEEDDE